MEADVVNVLSLCSGIGGLDLGLHLAVPRYRTVCYVESETYCQEILLARMADGLLDRAPIWGDLRTFDAREWRGVVDCVAAGFPCQPFSTAGRRRGDADSRNLWPDVRRVVAESEPATVFLENVPGALPYFFHVVLPELSGLGYRAAAGLFTAAEVGAPHRRQRLFVLAHRRGGSKGRNQSEEEHEPTRWGSARSEPTSSRSGVAHPKRAGLPMWPPGPSERDQWARILAVHPELAPAVENTPSRRRKGSLRPAGSGPERTGTADPDWRSGGTRDDVTPQPAVRLLADEPAFGLDRTRFSRTAQLRALGNAVVPAQVMRAWLTLSHAGGEA